FAGAVIGVAVGVVAAVSRTVRDFLDPLVATVNVIPAVITLPVIALWTGVGTETIILVTAYSTMIPVYRGAIDEIKVADRRLTWAAHSLGARGPRYVRSVVLPLVLIGAVRTIRVALGYAWRASIAAEILVVAQQGLGSLTFDAHQFGNIATMLAALVTILVVGLVLDLGAMAVQSRVLQHRGLIGR
ncbi:MAG TPA: ABC transporter permease subunit, partial [Streptosporangiales bacterium]